MDLFLIIISAGIAGIIIGVVVEHLMRDQETKEKKPYLLFTFFTNNFLQIKSKNMAVVFKANQNATFQVAPVDRKGKPAKVEAGSVSYNSPDPDVVVEEDPNDETKFKVTTAATEVTESRTVDIAVSADADTGEGVKTISGVLTIVLEPETAEGFGITTLTEPTDNEAEPDEPEA